MHLASGTRLGPYEIVAPLGAGGMGEVFRARDMRIGRDVAVKVLPQSFAADEERLRRFESEARVIGALNHPNLVTIHDLGAQDGSPYIVMELLEGETLRDQINTNALPVRKAIDYSVQIATGLASAHEKGVVHRDLKPENIFVTRDGRVKILDFGLARMSGSRLDDRRTDMETVQKGITSPGTVLGTVGYMSPEQVRGQEVDHRTDIFALGAILYEMLTGDRAFRGSSSADVMSAILKEDPPEIHRTTPQVTPALNQLVQHCLEKNREERFQSARDLAFDLKTISGFSGSGPAAQAAQAMSQRKVTFAAGAVAAVLIAAALGYFAGARTKKPPMPPRLVPLTYEGGMETQPALAPDGNSFLYVSNHTGNDDIYLRRIGGETAINLTKDSAAHESDPAFSPDGQLIAFRSERDGGGIFLMGATGESVRRLTDFGFQPAWSPDGKELVVQTVAVPDPTVRPRNSQMWRIAVATGERKQIDAGPDAVEPSWSPDGSRIAFWGVPVGVSKRVLFTVPAAGGEPVALTEDAYFNWNPVWSADGKYLYFSSDRSGTSNIWRMPIDQRSGKRTGDPQPVTISAHASSDVTVARDGARLLYVASSTSMSIEKMSVKAGSRPEPLLTDSRRLHYLACSRDGQWLVFRAGLAPEDLFIVKSDGTALRRLTNDPFKDRVPGWSGDGQYVYFMSDRSGRYDIWRIRADGSGLEQVTLTTSGDNIGDPRVSPDGKKLAVTLYGHKAGRHGGVVDLTLPRAQRRAEPLPLVDGRAFTAEAWSPDSTRVAGSVAMPDGRRGWIGVYSFATRQYHRVAEGGTNLTWLRGEELAYTSRGSVMIANVLTKRAREVVPLPKNVVYTTASEDGSALYFLTRDIESDIWMATLDQR